MKHVPAFVEFHLGIITDIVRVSKFLASSVDNNSITWGGKEWKDYWDFESVVDSYPAMITFDSVYVLTGSRHLVVSYNKILNKVVLHFDSPELREPNGCIYEATKEEQEVLEYFYSFLISDNYEK